MFFSVFVSLQFSSPARSSSLLSVSVSLRQDWRSTGMTYSCAMGSCCEQCHLLQKSVLGASREDRRPEKRWSQIRFTVAWWRILRCGDCRQWSVGDDPGNLFRSQILFQRRNKRSWCSRDQPLFLEELLIRLTWSFYSLHSSCFFYWQFYLCRGRKSNKNNKNKQKNEVWVSALASIFGHFFIAYWRSQTARNDVRAVWICGLGLFRKMEFACKTQKDLQYKAGEWERLLMTVLVSIVFCNIINHNGGSK